MSKLKSFYKYICNSLIQIKSNIICKDKLGYWDKLYDKYYEEYKSLSTKDLRRLQSIKSVNYNVNLSYPWTTIFISAVLGTVVSNIINVFNFISSDIPINIDQSIIDVIAWIILGVVIFVPIIVYFYLSIKKMSASKINVFYILFLAFIILMQFAKKKEYETFLNNGIILLAGLDIYALIVTILDIQKQEIGIECAVIKDLLLEKEEDNKN